MASFPTLYSPSDAFADAYAPRTAEFTEEGRRAGLRPSNKDKRRVVLVLVDVQWDFVHPTGALSVPGAQADTQRTNEFIYRNAEELTTLVASLDSHVPFQIFFPSWWQYVDDQSTPPSFTMLVLQSNGEVIDAATGRRVQPIIDPLWSLEYVAKLKAGSQKDLMLWPYHTEIGKIGHMLMPSLSEAITWHSAARRSQPTFLTKGTVPQVEHYGIFSPEVLYPKNPLGGINTDMLNAIAKNDLIYISGQAKSHCVLATMHQLLAYFANQPDIISKIRFLMDCTSSVVHPAVDFEAIAMAELQKMERLGVRLVTSTDPIG